MTIEFKKTSTVQIYDTTKLLAHDSIVRSDGSEEDTWRDATTSDLVAALAALEEEEWVGVLRELDAGPPTAPSWLSDAAEALGEVRPEDGAPLALNWTQVVRAIYDQRAERDEWRARAEKAEAEITEVRRVLGVRENSVTASTAAWRMGEIRAATVRAETAERERDKAVALQDVAVNRLAVLERERDEARSRGQDALARAEKAEHRVAELLDHLGEVATQRNGETIRANNAERERERDEARKELDRVRASLEVVRHDLDGTRQELREAREARDHSARLRDEILPETRAELGAARDENVTDAARRVVAERDSLRTRLIAAESAAAAREPREYPLAEGSQFDGDTLVTAGKAHVRIRPYGSDGPPTLSMELLDGSAYWVFLADVLALAHRRGLV